MIYDQIINDAKKLNKNILILASPRSGTHALGAELAARSGGVSIGEFCMVGYSTDFWKEYNSFASRPRLSIAHIVQLTPKVTLAENVAHIKEKTLIVNIKRKNKIDQFASWMYFRVKDPTALHGWHNHRSENTRVQRASVNVTHDDITLFKLDQMVDEFFFPDYRLCYEDLMFDTQKTWTTNSFSFPLREIFSNLDFVTEALGNWEYAPLHFSHCKTEPAVV